MEKPLFHIRVRIDNMEVEIGGERGEVLLTLDELDDVVQKVSSAFNVADEIDMVEPKIEKKETTLIKYPKIRQTNQCGEAVTALLRADWGKTPRTISELREAMEANAIFFPKTTLSGVLVWLVKRGKIRRWKDPKRGYLYVISESEDE
jgi:hypothetical protein